MECVESFVYATHDYEMPGKGFLPLNANDVLFVMEADPSGWWLGRNTKGTTGVFPSTYTQPFLFQYPSESIQQTLAHLRRANDFQLDLVSGVPRPLAPFVAPTESLINTPQLAQVSSLDEMYIAVNDAVLQRETVRAQVGEDLSQLCALEHASYAASLARPVTPPESAETAAFAASDETDISHTLARISQLRGEPPCVDAVLPTMDWYRRYSQVLKESSRTVQSDTTLVAEAVLTAAELRLQDLQRRVALREKALEALAPAVKEKEQYYLDERHSLRRRITIRDELVSLLIAHWARKAEWSRAEYLQAKATNQQAEVSVQKEEEHLRLCVQSGRDAFLALTAESKQLNARAKALRAQLLQKHELEKLEERIAAANETITSLRRRQRTSITQAR